MNLDPSAFVADPELLEALEVRATPVRCDEDRVLFKQGERAKGLYLLRSGEVRLNMKALSGEPVAVLPMSPGSLLGLPAVVGNGDYSLSAEAHKGAELSYLSREDFAKLMLEEPALSMMILRVLAAEVRTARIAIAQLQD